MDEKERRTALADFLRTRRARLRPAEMGLPLWGQRRTPGLRREEVAMLTGIGVTWYTWLEQGRDVKASEELLERLGTVLRLSTDERRHLFILAGYPPPKDLPEPRESLQPQLQALLDALDPCPAHIQGLDAGLHACLELRRDDAHEEEMVARSYQQGVLVHALHHYYLGSPDKKGLLLGYGGLEKAQIMEGARKLVEVIREV